MAENTEILNELKALNEKLDRILLLLEEMNISGKKTPKAPKPKPVPLTQEEIDSYRAKFDLLYEKWMSGQEVEVQGELENFNADDLRRFADANNLNVTSKMPKQKVLHLIGARFRERKQLFRGVASQNHANT
jgi:hypothetical protein